jgi:predicted dehydrogenase/aryl-alcohol dehydrogenase-like predicted oxidoreductase
MSQTKLSWGIIGTGGIAKTFAQGLLHSKTGKLVAVGSRDHASAKTFAEKFGPIQAHGSYDALLADPTVQAVYISTPHPFHAEWCIKAARAKKHILCEKPLTLNHAEAMVVAETARENGVFLMEAFMYRCHPQTEKLVELIRSGEIGEVGVIQATFSFKGHFHPQGRLFSNELGGGGILDVGCYATSIARLVAGAAQGQPFANPTKVTGFATLYPETGTDSYAVASAQFPGGILAQLSAGVGLHQESGLRVFGSKGSIHIPHPFTMSREGGESAIFITSEGSPTPKAITIKTDSWLYSFEADAVAEALAQGKLESPAISVADTLGNMAALDAWRASAGFTYESEKLDFSFPTISRNPLQKRADVIMPYGRIEGVPFPVSRLVLGCDNQTTMPHGTAIYDDFFERGGNAFDTGYIYGGGLPERLFGRWIEQRGIRSQSAIIVKGAHTPLCTPKFLTSQLFESLERLRTDYADMYIMHRDNLEIPVGEFVDVLNEHFKAGRIKSFGGSNWTLARLQEANAYAEKKGLQKFGMVSNNFSLAEMISPIWADCISAKDAAFTHWLEKNQTPLLAWSSQARGFFTERAGRDKLNDEEVVRCWYSENNFKRRDRAIELAKKKGVLPIHIALAFVLAQKFPLFALIGPRFIAETSSSFEGLSVKLTPEEVSWLDLSA